MKHLHRFFALYRKSGAGIVVLIVFIVAVVLALFLPNVEQKNLDIKFKSYTKNSNTIVRTQSGGPCNADPSIDGDESSFVGLLNQYRASHGLPAVNISTSLSQMAQWTANDMVNVSNILAHTDTLGRGPETRGPDCGAQWSAEILDEGGTGAGVQTGVTGASALAIFESSSAHNAIILDSDGPYVQIGVGHVTINGKGYWAAEFSKTNDGTNGGTGNAGGGGGSGGGGNTTGGVTQCTCPDGGIISPETGQEDDHYLGVCGHGPYTGTDGNQWTCSDTGWQQIPTGGCINGAIEDPATGNHITKFYLGTNGVPVCGDDNKEYLCSNGSWNPTGNSCGPNSGAGGGGITQPPAGGGGGGGNNPTPTIPVTNQYNIAVTLDRPSYKPGDTMNLCYKLSAENIPFTAIINYSTTGGGNYVHFQSYDDDGVGGGGCIQIDLDSNAALGPRSFQVLAYMNGAITAQGYAQTTVTATGSPSATPTVSPTSPVSPTTTISPTQNPIISSTPGVPTATISPTPTALTPTITQPLASNTPQPSTTPISTSTPTPTTSTPQTTLNISATLTGIGPNPATGENNKPVMTTLNGQAKVVNIIQDADFAFDSQSSTFKASITTIPPQTADIKIRTDNSLWKDLGSLTLTQGQTTTAPVVKLTLGDLNQDNTLDLQDYNIFLSCYGTKSCNQKSIADLNKDGIVDEKDLNIFYSGLANRNGD